MKITQQGSRTNVTMTFSNGYSVSLTSGHRVGLEDFGIIWAAYWSAIDTTTISVNEWMYDDEATKFLDYMSKLEPVNNTVDSKEYIDADIIKIFGGNG